MVVTAYVCETSWHDDGRACALKFFAPYTQHKFRLTFSFTYLWLWHISVLTPYNFLSAEYVRVQLVNFLLFPLSPLCGDIFPFSLCLHVVSYPVSFCFHTGFDYLSSCIHVGLDLFLVWPNLNHISNRYTDNDWRLSTFESRPIHT